MLSGRCLTPLFCAGLIAACGNIGLGADNSFLFEAASPQPYTAGYLGNGAMGVATRPLGTEPARCFLAGVYDHTAGDVPRIASAPAWNEVDIYNGSHWLDTDGSFAAIEQYQALDMFNGLLRTSYTWVDGEKKIRIEAEEFVARDRAELAAARVTLTPDFAGTVTVRFPLHNWPPPHRYSLERIPKLERDAETNPWLIWYPGQLNVSRADIERSSGGVVMSVTAAPPGNPVKLGEAIAIGWTGSGEVETHKQAGSAEAEVHLKVKPGESYTFTKFASLITSSGATDPSQSAERTAIAARQAGWETRLAASEAAWHALWESDIVVDGNVKVQRTIHSMLFYLLGSTREGLDMSTAPMGLSTAGYFGHIFWDADTFIFPPLVVLHPELARPMVAFRSRTREAARRNAERNGYKGAMFPWEADQDGMESTPRFASQNASSENHVNGDVALAAWQYWLATGDRNWLRSDAWPLLRDTADFWASRVKPGCLTDH